MRHPLLFLLAIVILSTGMVLLFRTPWAGVLLLALGALLLVLWHSRNTLWRCSTCGCKFAIGIWRNFTALSGGGSYKLLPCPRCKIPRWCRGTPKEEDG